MYRWFAKSGVKDPGLTREMCPKLADWRLIGADGILCVGVKSVDTQTNTESEGILLDKF